MKTVIKITISNTADNAVNIHYKNNRAEMLKGTRPTKIKDSKKRYSRKTKYKGDL